MPVPELVVGPPELRIPEKPLRQVIREFRPVSGDRGQRYYPRNPMIGFGLSDHADNSPGVDVHRGATTITLRNGRMPVDDRDLNKTLDRASKNRAARALSPFQAKVSVD